MICYLIFFYIISLSTEGNFPKTFSSVFDPIERLTVPLNYACNVSKHLNYVKMNDRYKIAYQKVVSIFFSSFPFHLLSILNNLLMLPSGSFRFFLRNDGSKVKDGGVPHCTELSRSVILVIQVYVS